MTEKYHLIKSYEHYKNDIHDIISKIDFESAYLEIPFQAVFFYGKSRLCEICSYKHLKHGKDTLRGTIYINEDKTEEIEVSIDD